MGDEGNDLIAGRLGNDYIVTGSDELGGRENTEEKGDWALGGHGDDHIYGSGGGDFLQGGAGHDYIQGNGGRDIILGDGDVMFKWGTKIVPIQTSLPSGDVILWGRYHTLNTDSGPLKSQELDKTFVVDGQAFL